MQKNLLPIEILLVDDREENLLALESTLQSPEYLLIKATSGDEALRYLLDRKPALILLDVQMPRLDGYETATLIKGSERTRDIPIIFLTALSRDEHFVLKGYETGAVDYINKPYDIEILRSKVRVFAELHRKNELLLTKERELRSVESRERERKLAALELRGLRREQVQQKRFQNLVQGINHGIVWSAHFDSMAFSYVGSTAEKLLGYSLQQWMNEPDFWTNHIHPDDAAAFAEARRKLIDEHHPVEIEHRFMTWDGRVLWFHTGLRTAFREDGPELELHGLSIDITRLKEAELSLQRSKQRSDILASASLALADSFESETGLKDVGQLIVPDFADWFSIDVLSDSKLKTACVECAAPLQAANLEMDLGSDNDYARVIESRESILYSETSEKILARISSSAERLKSLKPIRSVMIAPITSRGKAWGVVTVGSLRKENTFDRSDLAFLEGLTSHIAAAMEISRLYNAAQAAVIQRDEFLSVASHELKTPLTPLKLQVQQLMRMVEKGTTAMPNNTSGVLRVLERQITRLTKLIEDLLDISRINRGRLQLDLLDFNLDDLIRDVIQRFAKQFEEAKCRVELDIESNLTVHWDQFRIEQVIVNLITNATKFAGGKPVYIRAFKRGPNVCFSVRDEGIGISPENQQRIFNRFERAVSTSHFGGLGLGLYIVSQILDLHGGMIRVESELGHGAEFFVEIPAIPAAQKTDLALASQ